MSNETYFRWSYPDEKFSGAIDALVSSFGPNWERMANALLQITHLLPAHFPDQDLYLRTRKLLDFATERGPLMMGDRVYQGSIEHTLRRRKPSSFEKMAREISDIYEQIELRRGDYVPKWIGLLIQGIDQDANFRD